ncbi:MAG: hypothetical protein KDJ75_08225 [Alphaproteobacteria bacterium]|nr:hypothetical protein [Alphaproteobacteria bacterium]
MKRLDPRNFIVLALVGLSGAVLLHVSQNVQKSEDKLAEIEASIDREQETIRVLRAEWAYLNRPDRLERLAHEFLDLVPPEAEDVAATPSYLPERVQEDDVSSPSASPSLIEAQPIAFGASEEPSGDAGAIRPRPKPSFSKKRTYLREPSDAAERPTKNFQSLLDELGGGASR